MTDQEKVIAMLNEAYRRDPLAMHALMMNRVPCSDQLADDPCVVVDTPGIAYGEPVHLVGALGLINGVLNALGVGRVAGQFDDDSDFLQGFQRYKPNDPKS